MGARTETPSDARVSAAALWSRALVVGSMAFFLGVTGHVMADGLLPGPVLVTALLAATVLTTAPVVVRRVGAPAMVALLVVGQTFIHLCLTMTAGHRGDHAVTAAGAAATPAPRPTVPDLGTLATVDGRRVGSLQDAYRSVTDVPPGAGGDPLRDAVGHLVADLHAHAPMMLAHLLAAALVGLWLAHGERVLWTLVELTTRALVALVRPVAAPAVPRRVATRTVTQASPGPRTLWIARSHARRGPPRLLLAVPAR
ncbi:hypothetical protein [Nocardioides flavescens]|uniref:Uncharacterized protein n=1 Tax=Nocardioides flavescens TaxID=2691959 RepID=A0A6L7EW13_9ACTN|nr:hypothetical protein [Nocardioides flavescens]MXG88179.1 hypothetical protein [Nocardioides flavescens]